VTPQWTASLSLGHDDQALASPEYGVVQPVSEGFLTGSSRLLLRWTDAALSRRLDLDGSAAATGYGSQVEGGDTDLRLGAGYRQRLTSRWAMDVSGGGWRSRRGAAGSVLDLDLARAGARIAWTSGDRWMLTAGVLPAWLGFPERLVASDSTESERQRQLDVSAGGLCRFGVDRYVGAEFVHRRTTSNQDRSEYRGPLFVLRAGTPLIAGWTLTAYGSYTHRAYDVAPVLTVTDAGALDTLGVRRDDGWLVSASIERRVGRRAHVFLDGSYLHQTSNDTYYAFDQARIAVGISVDLTAPTPARQSGLELARPGPLAPVVTGQGVRFRYRAARAQSVALVGGFNGWDGKRSPLVGPGKDGVWEIVVPLAAGVWRYAFLVDGEWVSPPDASRYEEDGFGGRNGVIHVR
jgi:hypothetical protein